MPAMVSGLIFFGQDLAGQCPVGFYRPVGAFPSLLTSDVYIPAEGHPIRDKSHDPWLAGTEK